MHWSETGKENPRSRRGSDGRYWARTSDPQLVELVLNRLFAGSFFAVGKYLGKSHSGEGGSRRS
jgi:hypothetical protein